MPRKKSKIVSGLDGRKYRVTLVDDKGQEQRTAWDRDNLITASTRLSREEFAAYNGLLYMEGKTMYSDLKYYIQSRILDSLRGIIGKDSRV